MASDLSLEFIELEECLSNLQEIQKSLENDMSKNHRTEIVNEKTEMKTHLNKMNKIGNKTETEDKQIKSLFKDVESKKKSEMKSDFPTNKQICTDLDQLIQMMKQSETKKDIDNYEENNKIWTPKIKEQNHNNDNLLNDTRKLKSSSLSRMKNMKLDQHNQNLIARFSNEKQLSYYGSLPKIISTNDEDCFTVIYKTSSQTNLSHPTSDYKMPLTVYQPNRTMKTILIDETTTAGEICQLLTARNYLMPCIKFSLVEKTSHLKIERIFEDDETPVLYLLSYPDGGNKSMVFFEDREDKYGLFTDPGKWLGSNFAENEKERYYINEIFDGPFPQLPRYKSHLFYRKLHRKTWKRSLCVLRNSGIYAYKKSNKNDFTDLQLIISLHPSLHLYTTIGGWSQCKAPTPYGFCLKTYGEQNPKYIAYFCAPSEASLRYWSSMFRIALKGKTLFVNYQTQIQFVADTLSSFQEMNEIKLLPHLSKSLGCVTGRADLQTDL